MRDNAKRRDLSGWTFLREQLLDDYRSAIEAGHDARAERLRVELTMLNQLLIEWHLQRIADALEAASSSAGTLRVKMI